MWVLYELNSRNRMTGPLGRLTLQIYGSELEYRRKSINSRGSHDREGQWRPGDTQIVHKGPKQIHLTGVSWHSFQFKNAVTQPTVLESLAGNTDFEDWCSVQEATQQE